MVKLKNYFYINSELSNTNCTLFQELGQCFLYKYEFLRHFYNKNFNTDPKVSVINILML